MNNKEKNRIALSIFFFLSGFCFSTWASRIPTLKATFAMDEATLGSFLFILPISSLLGLPFSGWLVSKFDSRQPLKVGFIFFLIGLIGIGLSTRFELLVLSVFLFAFSMRVINISMNTQAIQLQKQYTKKINGRFHGIWSLGGLCGLLASTSMLNYGVSIAIHIIIIAIVSFVVMLLVSRYLLKNDREVSGNKLYFGKPDKFILYIGLVVFCAAVCEGGIYDWSSVYFRDIVGAELFTLSYLVFMISMTLSRFFVDRWIDAIGMKKLFTLSTIVIVIGVSILILMPYFYTALLGFFITGFGVASIFPMSFMLAGQSKKYAPGMAISIVGTYSTIGVLLAPPFVGYLAHLFKLNWAFTLFVAAALFLVYFSRKAFSHLTVS
ncbi:MAG: MFS transporter [Flavobacteriaceae bacterium]